MRVTVTDCPKTRQDLPGLACNPSDPTRGLQFAPGDVMFDLEKHITTVIARLVVWNHSECNIYDVYHE